MAESFSYSLLPYGPDAWLVQLEDATDFPELLKMQSLHSEVILESVLGYDSLLLRTNGHLDKQTFTGILNNAGAHAQIEPKHHEVHVDYHGPDLDEVCQSTGLDKEKVISLHSEALYTVRFLGFSPGFAYLDGLPEKLHLPRRSSPRTRMEAGAVAIGGSHAGIYTIPSPGGWNWLGHTKHPLFDPTKEESAAFTLRSGDTLRFIPNTHQS